MTTLFEKIILREIPADIVFENDAVIAFRDINPQAPVHVLIVPKKPLASVSAMETEDVPLMGQLMQAATSVAEKLLVKDYRLVINNGAGAGQTVFHLHMHLLAGRSFSWPPG